MRKNNFAAALSLAIASSYFIFHEMIKLRYHEQFNITMKVILSKSSAEQTSSTRTQIDH